MAVESEFRPAAIANLLAMHFSPEDLARYAHRVGRAMRYPMRLDHELPMGGSRAAAAYELVELFERHGLWSSPEPYVVLAGLFPADGERIRAIATGAGVRLPLEVPRLFLRPGEGGDGRPKRIFLSYSRKDSEWARTTRSALLHADIEVFLDEASIRRAEDFAERIEGELRRSDRILVGWSEHAARSDWVGKEIALALEVAAAEGIPRFVAVERLDDTPLPPSLETVQAVESEFRRRGEVDEAIRQLPVAAQRLVLDLVRELQARRW